VNNEVNQLIADTLNDPEAPLDILGVFDTLDLSLDKGFMTLGQGACARNLNGEIEQCDFVDDPPPAEFNNVLFSTEAKCMVEPEINAHCFRTNEAEVAIKLLDIVLGLKKGLASGHFTQPPAYPTITPGVIKGFLPEAFTKTVGVEVPGFGMVPLYDLFKDNPTSELDGLAGWNVELSFEASLVPFGAEE
jgi:hypothetical protein